MVRENLLGLEQMAKRFLSDGLKVCNIHSKGFMSALTLVVVPDLPPQIIAWVYHLFAGKWI